MKNYQIVVIDNPYANWGIPFVQEIYSQIIELKRKGFASRFSKYYAPVDKSDFHGIHLALCEYHNEKLRPICTFRGITQEQCKRYGFTFTGLTVADSTNSVIHIEAIKNFIDKNADKNISYFSAFAVEPSLTKEERREVTPYLIPLFAFCHLYWGIEKTLAIGSCKTHTDQMYHDLGLFPIKLNGETLPPVSIPSCQNEFFEIQALESLSQHCIEEAKKSLTLWKDRIHISDYTAKDDLVESFLFSNTLLEKKAA